MGRAFEFRKARKFKRWDKMSKAFTRLGKEIVMAVKEAGPNPETNSRLRTAMNNAKGVNMPKDRVEAAIKRASSKEEKDYEEVVYEGYGPHGIAILVETATDNINRTIANMRVYFSRAGGAVGKTGSLDFIFTRKGIFKINPEGVDIEELELELIDFGADDIYEHEGEIIIETAFSDFGQMQKALEEKGLNVISAELQRIPNTRTELTDEQAEEIENLVEKIEEDDDVQAVYHNMA
ncbi:YebC/PmpR family DNA-binding transcriptional regulator [Pontibacter sp. BT310]|uniref:Probable transcriptional regulatory protein KYK27_10740 n=1 Tax=Pontibacter populi TaxID=890055 RepID=A0ABS6XE92_9BACT|nr:MULTISPECIES: YebC/PmpR family DNA-binding transcriptional regulator [Pontibacter]MBJ6118671.1 YebC/PmpR family DNA-binding transcriptional regulator [Pontibacter sp. BT310]MBR0571100.1 YebC/PmpR family DNA-binding transcriptional regulator [Microvirga sp. STS03]MBW3365525.1 YebC/PmpR family DNA-binding transcriptional regulator [Pontibacter populi]